MTNVRRLVVGVAESVVTSEVSASIVTYALGSCVGIAIHDPVARVGGMLHIMLPSSSLDASKAERFPSMFADTGIPLFLRKAASVGAENRRLVVHVAGGSQVMEHAGSFNIGRRNCQAVREAIAKAGLTIHGESTGGREPRTLRLDVGSVRVFLRAFARAEREA